MQPASALGTQEKNASGVYQTSVGEPSYTVGDQPILVDGAIESGVPKGSNNAIEGYVINQRNGNLSVYPETENLKPIPMEGVRIYAQWVEKDGATSPIYTTTTGADGYFTLGMKPFEDALGKVRNFDADPQLPEGEKFRIWAENPDPDVFTQLYGAGMGKLFPSGNVDELTAGMRNLIGSNQLVNARFAFGEKVQNDVMHNLDASVENAPWKQAFNAYGQVAGKVYWDLDRNPTAIGWNDWAVYNKADVPAKGMKVYGSYLSDYALSQIYNEAQKDLGFRVPTASRSSLSRDEEAAVQNWIKRRIAEEGKDKWIAETVETTVGEGGDYTLQFKGTFGRAWDDRGYDDGAAVYSDLARDTGAEVTFPDGSKHKAYDLFNTVAPAADYGSWMHDISASGRGAENLSKHINWDWLFVSTEDVDGAAVVTPFHTNAYTGKMNVSTDQTWAGVWNTAQAGRLANNNMFLYPDYTVFDVLEYDTQQNYAKPGDVAETSTSGLPTQFVDGLKYEIEWVNTNTGKVVHKCEAQPAKGDTTIDSCPLDTGDANLFPDGITETTTFAANLYPVDAETGERGDRIATDAFTVLVDWAPEYEPQEGLVGEQLNSGAPTFDRTDTDEVEKLTAEQLAQQDADKQPKKFELPETFTIPEGYDISVDEATGEVSLTFPKGTEPGTEFEVPVKVTHADNTSATGTASFVVQPQSDVVEPSYEDKTVVPGEETKSSPTFTDKDGNPTEAPEGSKFKITDGFTAPEGYDVAIDENTGEITVTAPEELDAGTVEEFDVPVTVTYPDGSTDDATATFELDTDGDGTPDSKDDDDDNDGISDEEEKDKGSNPKDEGSIPATPLEPGITNPSVVTDKETVIEGQETDPFDTADNVPEGGKVEVDNLPGGLEVDPETGKVTGTPDKLDDWGKDEEERDVTVTVTITDKDGKEVAKEDKVITVQRDTDGDGTPDVTDEDDDNDGVSDEDEKKAGTDPKDPNSKPGGEVDDTTAPEIDPIAPGDKEISGKGDRPNEEITVTFPDGSTVTTTTDENGNWKVEVPSDVELNPGDKVVVTDGAGNQADVTVEDTDGRLKQNNEYDPSYSVTWGRAGQSATSVAPTFTRNLSGFSFKRQPAPEGVKYQLGAGAPAGATIDAEGRVTVQLPKGQAEIAPIPVVVRYADGTKDATTAEFKVRERALAETTDIEYQQGVMADPGETVEVNHLENELPEGTEFTLAPGQDFQGWFIHVDPATGVLSATAPEKGGADSLKVLVKVTYLDGSQEEVTVGVVKKPAPQTSRYEPRYEEAIVGKRTAHHAPQLVGLPKGTTFSIANDGGLDVEVNEKTGELRVKARPDSIPAATHQVTVRAQYPDRTSELVTAAFTVDSQARTNTTTWETITVPVKGIADETHQNPAPKHTRFAIAEDFAKTGWAVDVHPTTGKLTVAADKTVRVGETAEIPVVLTLPDSSQRVVMVKAVATQEVKTCDTGSSLSSLGSSESCRDGSSDSRFGIISIILGVLALVGGAGAALYLNQDTVRDILRQNGINI